MIESVGVIGGGAWGTALALVASRAGRTVRLWARDEATVSAIDETGENPRYLPGVSLGGIRATNSMSVALRADAVLLVVPAQSMRAVASAAAPYMVRDHAMVVCAKGLERGTGKRMSEVIAEVAPHVSVGVLSGPSFADDVARALPTAVTIAAQTEPSAAALCQALSTPRFRPYASTDLIGVEIGGAVKNVLAIAAGIIAGRGLGASALAAMIARGFAELQRLAEILGARPDTLMGLSGLGDLVLTCSSDQSRNFGYGRRLGEGIDRNSPHPLVEGIATAAVARDLARRHRVSMPIVSAIVDVIEGKLAIDGAIEGLMARPLKSE